LLPGRQVSRKRVPMMLDDYTALTTALPSNVNVLARLALEPESRVWHGPG